MDAVNKDELFSEYDTFIGFDSSLLFEATLANCFSVSLMLPEVESNYVEKMPYSYAVNVCEIEELPDILQYRKPDMITLRPELFAGSIERSTSFVSEFIEKLD